METSTPPTSTSTRGPSTVDGRAPVDGPPSARPVEEIRADLATEEGRGSLTRQSPIGRLCADVPSLLAEVEAAHRFERSVAVEREALLAEYAAREASQDRIREQLQERIAGQASTISTLGQVAAEAGRVMEALRAHGAGIVGHLLDSDDNAGERLRELLRDGSLWALRDGSSWRERAETAEAERDSLRGVVQAVREWAHANHGGIKTPAEVWPGLAALLAEPALAAAADAPQPDDLTCNVCGEPVFYLPDPQARVPLHRSTHRSSCPSRAQPVDPPTKETQR